MRTPNFEAIRRERAEGRSGFMFYTARVHPNPRFYKYYWWVFWSGSPVDGEEFLEDEYRLSTAAAIALSAELRALGEPSWWYNHRLPRRDPANPFDADKTRWADAEWAPAYDDDPDPTAPKPLAGHK